MPTSHDSKPRNRWRRLKYTKEMSAGAPIRLSPRQARRLRCRLRYVTACISEIELRDWLTKYAIKWREYEKLRHALAFDGRKVADALMRLAKDRSDVLAAA